MTASDKQGASPADYCLGLIAQADEDFHLSLSYAPAAARGRLAALFAFLIELRRIKAAVSEAPLGEIRLQWHREALDEIVAGRPPRAHPVIAALAAAGDVAPARPLFDTLIDARARLLYEPAFRSLDDFANFLDDAEAPVAVLALGGADPAARAAVRKLGLAHALARLAPALAPALAEEAARQARALHADNAPALRGLAADAFGRVAYLSLIDGHAARPDGRPWPVMKRLALFRAVATGRI